MKKIFFVLIIFVSAINVFARNNENGNVGYKVRAAFERDFMSTYDVSWKMIDDINVVSFSQRNENYLAYYTEDGELRGVGKIITKNGLPAILQNRIERKYAGAEITTILRFRSPANEVSYYVHLKTEKSMHIIKVDLDGSIEPLKTILK